MYNELVNPAKLYMYITKDVRTENKILDLREK